MLCAVIIMKIFVFERIDKCSDNYHEEGGLVVIAKDVEQAKELLKTDNSIEVTDEEWQNVESFALVDNVEPKFWVMPDAGCCK